MLCYNIPTIIIVYSYVIGIKIYSVISKCRFTQISSSSALFLLKSFNFINIIKISYIQVISVQCFFDCSCTTILEINVAVSRTRRGKIF